MRRLFRAAAIALAFASFFAACSKVPFTKRAQFNAIPGGMMNSLGSSTYKDMLAGASIERNTNDSRTLRAVGERIARAANQPKFTWQYSLIREDTLNAWCLPGGKIGFYTGILPVLESDAGMSFVMGHEVGHAVARHGAERMSQQLAVLGGLVGLEILVGSSGKMTQEQKQVVMGALGVGASVGVLLPFSRLHESEADVIGLMYMAKAGYPPEESVAVWDRMSRRAGPQGPAFLSTHPPNEKRKATLREWMPQAKKRWERSAQVSGSTTSKW